MSLDGIVINSIKCELSNLLVGGRIDKIYQPEADEVILSIRNDGSNYKLLLSASSNNPRVHLTEYSKQNPQSPPMFCMLLRKHIQGGRISSVSQLGLERAISISLQSKDELGDMVSKEIVIEIMGKHSNIILINSDTGKIMDSIKRIPAHMSSVRQVLPGFDYIAPPAQEKLNPLKSTLEDFSTTLKSNTESVASFKVLYKHLLGLSPLLAREICVRADMDPDRAFSLLSANEIVELCQSVDLFYRDVKTGAFVPNIVSDKDNFDVIAFSAVRLFQYKDYPFESFDSMSYVLEKFYIERDSRDRIKQRSSDLRKSISSKLERLVNKVSKQTKELEDSNKREKFKIKGDLLTANMHSVSQGDSSVTVQNFYSENLEKAEIRLDPRLSPSQNAQKYYKKYNKLKTASVLLEEQVQKSSSEIQYLNNILYSIDNCTELDELNEIKEELASEGYAKRASAKKKPAKQPLSKPHEFLSSDGYTIFVGKNNHQNDKLTMKTANKDDLWFHTKDIPGSHVIVKTDGADVPETTILEAALLSAYYSKASESSNVPVDYTERKNVKKPSGSKPGMVIYENNKTLYITPSNVNFAKIKKVES